VAPAAAEDHAYDDLPKEQRVAKLIAQYVGGMDNVRSAEHCATRLRLILDDKTKIQDKAIEGIDGVKGQFFAAAQYQIILGTGFVDKVYEAFVAGTSLGTTSNNKAEAYEQMTTVQKISRTLGDVFVPIIPVLVATGLFMGLRGAAQALGTEFSPNLMLMSQVLTDTAFAFLPALVCWSTMKRFGGTPVIGIVLGLMLVAPQLPNAYAIAGGTAQPIPMDILGFTVPVVGYQGSVLPALVLGIFAAKLQRWLKTFVPDIVDLIVTPFLTLLISMILGLLIVGPIMHTLELAIFGAVQAFLELPLGIGGFIVGGLQQVIVVFGVHHVFNALEVQLLATTGRDAFNAIITGAIVAQGGAAVAVALRTKDPKKRALYISSAVPAFLGITEPAIFGINLRFMKPFLYALVGGACAGGLASFLHLAGTGMGITVLPGTLLYLDNLFAYVMVNIVGFAVAFALTFTLFDPKE
jgi:PTS system sucrose-specific IIC component